ncbi:MAG: hypothetical protein FJ152_05520 [Firmicutes bacterium]|nr:hypothetical protein [Bacillota bacterium]
MLAVRIRSAQLVTIICLTLLLGLSLLSGCKRTDTPGSVTVWLDVPLDGLVFADLQDINIKGHAEAKGKVENVEIWINGDLLATISNPPMRAGLAAFHTPWTPGEPGVYTIQAVAYCSDGTASVPDAVRITFGEEPEEEPVVAEQPKPPDSPPIADEPPATETPPTEPKATIRFWADPPQIEAGDCTTIHWQVENADRVIFEGAEQPLTGAFRDCLCENKLYTMRVFNLDGSEERNSLEVRVTGSCVTPQPPAPPPPPPADTTPSPVPIPAVPTDGLSINCKAAQSMAWLPVTDPSGISEYRVEVQRHAGDNNWQPAPGGSQSGLQVKEATVNVECGWYYRWRVRAVDGAGNISPWSNWSHFAILLM